MARAPRSEKPPAGGDINVLSRAQLDEALVRCAALRKLVPLVDGELEKISVMVEPDTNLAAQFNNVITGARHMIKHIGLMEQEIKFQNKIKG